MPVPWAAKNKVFLRPAWNIPSDTMRRRTGPGPYRSSLASFHGVLWAIQTVVTPWSILPPYTKQEPAETTAFGEDLR